MKKIMADHFSNFRNLHDLIGYFLLSNLLYALAVNLFLVGNNIAAGGFVGFAIAINYISNISIGLIVLMLTAPVMLISLFIKGWKFTAKTLAATVIYSFFVDVTSSLPTLTDNQLVAAVFAGLLYAVAAVLMIKAGSSCGGTDLVARLFLLKFKRLSIGKMYLVIDGLTVIFGMFVFKNIEVGLYAIIFIYTYSHITDAILSGFDKANICYVISRQFSKPIASDIISRLPRGVTLLKGVGMYEGVEREMLLTIVRPRETHIIKEIVMGIDKDAFVVVCGATEVMGIGFQPTSRSLY